MQKKIINNQFIITQSNRFHHFDHSFSNRVYYLTYKWSLDSYAGGTNSICGILPPPSKIFFKMACQVVTQTRGPMNASCNWVTCVQDKLLSSVQFMCCERLWQLDETNRRSCDGFNCLLLATVFWSTSNCQACRREACGK